VGEPRLSLRVLDPGKLHAIRLQADLATAEQFFLAGGTGLALRLGHRLSDDLDWFTARRFSVADLERKLGLLAQKPSSTRRHGAQTLRAYYGALETSFIGYQQVAAQPDAVKVGGALIQLADIRILAEMKAAAVHDRGAKRDFIDIHAISSQPGWSVGKFIEHAAEMLPLLPEQVARALTYFVDAEKEPMPKGCKVLGDQQSEEATGIDKDPVHFGEYASARCLYLSEETSVKSECAIPSSFRRASSPTSSEARASSLISC